MYLTVLLALACLSTLLLTYGWLRLAVRNQWFDIPNQRSSHEIPTPKGGGIVFVGVFTLFVWFMHSAEVLGSVETRLLLPGLILAGSGLLDDLYELHILPRLGVQFVAVLLAVLLLPGLPVLPLPGFTLTSPLIVACLLVICWVWLVNLYNFMDGIDALATCEAIFVALSLAWMTGVADIPELGMLGLLLAAVLCGFLYFNLPRARVFMGDTGSNFLGFILGALSLVAVWQDAMTIWTVLILLGVFIVDSSVTLLRRMRSGLVWYHGHKSHAYQQAARVHNSHQKIVLAVCIINVCWLLPLAWVSVLSKGSGFWLTILAWLPLLWLVRRYHSHDPECDVVTVPENKKPLTDNQK